MSATTREPDPLPAPAHATGGAREGASTRHASVINALAYQGGWFACVLGGDRWGVPAAAMLLALHWLRIDRSRREWATICGAALLGLAMDLGWQRLGLISFRDAGFAGIPLWLAMLWLLFATTLRHALAWLQTRLWLAALLGALAGPLSYFAGLELGAARSALPHWQVALAMAPGWLLLLPLLAFLARAPSVENRAAAP